MANKRPTRDALTRTLLVIGIAALISGTAMTSGDTPALPDGTAVVKGQVKFSGTPPKRRPIDMGSEPKCHETHPEPMFDESVIVNENGTLRNVFVWIKKGIEAKNIEPPKEAVVLDQKGCHYEPHVLGVQVGQPLEIRNSDPLAHNVHGLPQLNKEFNFSQTQQGGKDTVTFATPEVMIKLKCDIHGWMSTYVGVVKHPWFFVTKEDGAFELPKLPAGEYVIEAWHEKYGKLTETVKVADGETKELSFTFEGKK